MKLSANLKLFKKVITGMIQKQILDEDLISEIEHQYDTIMLRAKDIGQKNPLLFSYALAAYFIAMNRSNLLSPDENYSILASAMKQSKMLKLFLGSKKHYFSQKKMRSRRAWSARTRQKKYDNDWVVDVIEKDQDFEFGLDYHECGVCKLCWDENCFELAKYLCKLDYLLVDVMGIHLQRTGTLAEGCCKCDFRFQL